MGVGPLDKIDEEVGMEAMLSEPVKKQVQEVFSSLRNPVEVIFFRQ